MFWPHILFSDLILAVGAENDQLSFVILWQLLREGSSCYAFSKNRSTKKDLLESDWSSCHVLTLLPWVKLQTVETLLPGVLCSITHCSMLSSNCGHLALVPPKLCLIFFAWCRSSSCFLHFCTTDSSMLNSLQLLYSHVPMYSQYFSRLQWVNVYKKLSKNPMQLFGCRPV